MNDKMFLQYTGKELGEICIACKVTENNFAWLAEQTGAHYSVSAHGMGESPVVRLMYGYGNNAEIGDYVINGMGGTYRPLEAEIFEENYER